MVVVSLRARAAKPTLSLGAVVACWAMSGLAGASETPEPRAFTQADAIEMTSIGDPEYWHHNMSLGRVAHYSPDRSKLAVVLRRGNLDEGVTEYSLLLYEVKDLLRLPAPQPDVMSRMSSSSNREAFVSLTWLPDNRTLLFLGERPGEERQLYSLDIVTRALTQLTRSETSVSGYSASADGARILYVAEKPVKPLWDDETRRNGVTVSNHHLADLIAGRRLPADSAGGFYLQSMDGASRPRRIELKERLDDRFTPLLSPDGRFALIRVFPEDIPQEWRGYSDPLLKLLLPDKAMAPGENSLITQFVIWDTYNDTAQTRVDAPQPSSDGGISAKWATDATSVLVTLLYLPLDGVGAKERQRRASGPFTAEIDLTGSVRPLASESLLNMARIESWDGESNVVAVMRDSTDGAQRTFFRKRGSGWQNIGQPRSWRAPLDVSLKEAMNVPPRIVVFDPVARQERTLLDLNPQFNAFKLARQEEIEWRATDGTRVRGGLYYPPDFVRGKRYPLVIQTHGWSPKLFAVDGIFVSAFAAQALANKGILVLQGWDYPEEGNEAAWQQYLATKMSTPAMHKLEQAIYEGAIDHLDSAGLVDRDKVGLIGFSYTAWSVKYTLAHPRPGYRFAAAAVSDGFDGGYFDYIVEANQAELAQQFESSAGGKPYGEGLQAWLREAPGFNVDKVDTPLRMLPLGNPHSLLHDWEWFVLLKRMGKPVELVMVENGAHTLVKPWDRMVVSGGNVQWFDFWLNGAKYKQWEPLRR